MKAGRWKKLLTVLPLITLAAVGSALSSSVLPSAEHHDDALSRSAKVATFGPSTPVRIDDATSRSPQKVELDGPTMCLALNIYWEARNQNTAGQLAVAQVTMNRSYDRRYPNDVCEVVYDHKQFSWYWDGKSDTPKEKRAWEKAILVASAAMAGSGHAELQGVTHYHAVYSQPYWKDYMTKVAMIGDHVFYVN
jgi:spore germination cell wall hydrolase CwlJ-like protein